MKRRLLKYLLIAFLVVVFTGYFAFSTFVFSPLEDDFRPNISTLIPRDIDFFVSKPHLSDDFAEFPELAVIERLEKTEAGETFINSPDWQNLRADLGVEELLGEIRQQLKQLPVELDPLAVLGGKDLAIAGYFTDREIANSDWAVYARGNWIAKLGVAGLMNPSLSGIEQQGFSVVVDGEIVSLSGAQLPRTLHITRHRDVVVISTSLKMVSDMTDLIARAGEDSFGGSARYFDYIQQRTESGDEASIFIDYRAFSESQQYTGRWPDAKSEFFGPAFMGRLFQSGAIKELIGTLGFAGGLSFDLHGELSSELVTPYQKQLYREKSFDKDTLASVARAVPLDAGLFAYLHAPMGATLRQALLSSERALQDNLNDMIRDVWHYPDAQGLIEDLDGVFRDRAIFMLRENDYPEDPTGPPHDDTPTFAWAAMLWVDDHAKLEEIRDAITSNQANFGIQGRDGASGVQTNVVQGGNQLVEYWSPFIPGTGHLASIVFEDRFIISNSFQMVGQLVKTYYDGSPTYPRLSEDPRFQGLVSSALGSANLGIWVRPEGLASTLHKVARRAAEDELVIDWSVMRGQIDRRVARENFPDWNFDTLTEDQARQLELLAAPERDKYERYMRDTQVPVFQAKYERQIAYLEGISAALFELGLAPKNFELTGRVLIPLEE